MITTNNCCWCASLRTGSLIIGWLQVILPLLNVIGTIYIIINGIEQSSATNMWADVILSVFQLAAGAMLLYGVYKLQRKYVFYYLCNQLVVIAIRFIMVIILTFISNQPYAGISLGLLTIVCAFLLYLLVVVYSYHEQMESSSFNV